MDVLFLGLIDYPCREEAVSLYEHESRRRSVLGLLDLELIGILQTNMPDI